MSISVKDVLHFFLLGILWHHGRASLQKTVASSPFRSLAKFLSEDSSNEDSVNSLVGNLKTLSKSQSTLKNIDGTSYEFYQRSHNNNEINEAITGRAKRTAGRVGACADALFACELLDQAFEEDFNAYAEEIQLDKGTKRTVVFNRTISVPIPMSIVVIFEQDYGGGAGVEHGGINGLMLQSEYGENNKNPTKQPRGRYLIVLKDFVQDDLVNSLQILDDEPSFFELSIALVSAEIACVNTAMWKSAAEILLLLQSENVLQSIQTKEQNGSNKNDILNDGNNEKIDYKQVKPAIHIVGRSLAGGVATLAALMLDGTIPIPKTDKKLRKRRRGKRKRSSKDDDDSKQNNSTLSAEPKKRTGSLHGHGNLRTSCVALGAPPCISANIKAMYVTSIVHGDDIICRSTKDSIDRLRQRVKRVQDGNVFTKQVGWMTDTLSLTFSSLKSHAHGSAGEEGKLSTPGNAYIIRPRRMKGGVCSIHEIGNRGGRESLRGALLWQLNDILLSRSMWKHHSLDSYINGLNRVELRKFTDGDDNNDDEEATM